MAESTSVVTSFACVTELLDAARIPRLVIEFLGETHENVPTWVSLDDFVGNIEPTTYKSLDHAIISLSNAFIHYPSIPQDWSFRIRNTHDDKILWSL